jgi:hypothetical protein
MLISMQMCEQCPAGYFCIGGSAARAACSAGKFSLPKSNSSDACQSAVFIMVSITLGVAQASFTLEMQNQYRNALANLCETSDYQVGIQSLSKAEWSVYGSDSIEVVFKIAVFDTLNSNLVVSRLKQEALQKELRGANLSDGYLNYFKVDSTLQNVAPANWILPVACTGAALGVFIMLGTAWLLKHTAKSPNERELQMMVVEIRKKLRITVKDGYAVGSEGHALFLQRQLIFLSRAQVEAAANLALMQDFDVNQFDVLCLTIRHSGASKESKERYELLGHWLLEHCRFLLKPDFPKSDLNLDRSYHRFKKTLTKNPSKRFQYFERRLIKARIWLEDRSLFSKVKIIAKGFMDELSVLCQRRYEALYHEPRGQELLEFNWSLLASTRYFPPVVRGLLFVFPDLLNEACMFA